MAPHRPLQKLSRRAFVLCAAAPAWAAEPASPRTNPPYEPWMLAHLAGLRRQDPLAVLLGDSLVAAWPADQVQRLFPDGAVNLGAGGDTTENLLWRVQQAFQPGMRLQHALVLVGTNDLPRRPPGAIADGVAAIIAVIRANAATAVITVVGVLPRRDGRLEFGAGVNALLRAMPGVRYADPGAFPADAYKDTVHLTPAGYARLTDAVLPVVRPPLPLLLAPALPPPRMETAPGR